MWLFSVPGRISGNQIRFSTRYPAFKYRYFRPDTRYGTGMKRPDMRFILTGNCVAVYWLISVGGLIWAGCWIIRGLLAGVSRILSGSQGWRNMEVRISIRRQWSTGIFLWTKWNFQHIPVLEDDNFEERYLIFVTFLVPLLTVFT
jgi:hypothetical protein